MSGLTKIEMEFCERVPYELGRIADSLEKIISSKEPKTEVPKPVKEEHPTESPFFDCLAVTSVQVFPFKDGVNMGHMKGVASVVINDQLQLRGLRIMDGENGLYVGYPNDPSPYKGEDLRSMYFPITRQLREHIENCVLEKYQEAIK